MVKSRSPIVARFLADFTLGFSDGLTVPFALSAGLSALGHTQTVIEAGLAELCAGSISMGIGGYLSALDEVRVAGQKSTTSSQEGDDEECRRIPTDGDSDQYSDKDGHDSESIVCQHLEPLKLPPRLLSEVLNATKQSKQGLDGAAVQVCSADASWNGGSSDSFVVWPWFSGLSISVGYVIGGLIPLLPYCISSTIGAALGWSVGLCLIAMFLFGFCKNWLLSTGRFSWSQSSVEGARMLLLGSLAAAAAVICIGSIEGSQDGDT